ncbi:MAG: AMP-binding protein, partial [Pseudomonadota bacterium]
MNFVETILTRLRSSTADPIVEVHGKKLVPMTAAELLDRIARARSFLEAGDVRVGDRVVLLAPNSANWVACDLAILASGAISVPLYSRQDPKELAFMARDCAPKLLIAADRTLADSMQREWNNPCRIVTFDELFRTAPADLPIDEIRSNDPVTIVYTSGTSGDPKGAILTCGSVDYMLAQTASRLRLATGKNGGTERVFHYLPVCFMGSRILLWTQLLRGNPLHLSTDLSNLQEELATAEPEYFLNVPALLERIRSGVDQKIREMGGFPLRAYRAGLDGYINANRNNASLRGWIDFFVAKLLVFRAIRKKIGSRIQFLICGSAPLSEETQFWFEAIGIPILQVYGLTETTAIVTMDRPGRVRTGWVGPAIDGCEVRLTKEGELVCRGPNLFAGYWNRPKETDETIRDGWLYTGDVAEIDKNGNIRIVGRTKNILVPASGHNVFPEPIEQQLKESCPTVEHVVLIGHGRPYLAAIVTG